MKPASTPSVRMAAAKVSTSASCFRVSEATRKLEELLDSSSSGIPIRQMDENDSLAVSMDGARQETITQTNRSRRALRAVGSERSRSNH